MSVNVTLLEDKLQPLQEKFDVNLTKLTKNLENFEITTQIKEKENKLCESFKIITYLENNVNFLTYNIVKGN